MKFIRTGIWILVFASFAVVVSSCAKEYTEDSPLLLPEVEEVLSSTYFANDKAVFTNESLDSMSFFISADKRVSPQELPDGDEVYMEDYFVSLVSDTDEQISLVIFGGAFINADLSEIRPSLDINFMPYNTTIGNLTMDIRLDEGFATSVYETEYNDAKTFLDKSYEEVYSVWDSSAPAYSELHFSTKDGVVAFKDKHEVLWTLSHYVE